MIAGESQNTVVAFCCENSALPALEDARHAGTEIPGVVQTIRVPCAGKVEEDHILKALESGAEGVIILACHKDSCQYIQGNVRAEKRLVRLQQLLGEVDHSPECIRYVTAAPSEAARVARLLRSFVQDLSGVDSGEEAIER